MQADGAYYFIEVGPGSVLTNLASSILQDSPHLAVAIDRSGKNGITQLLNTLAQLWAHGVDFDARVLYEGRIEQIPQPVEQSTVGPNGKPKLLYLMDSQNISRANGTATTPTAKPLPQAQARPQVQTPAQQQGQPAQGQPQVQPQPQGKPVSSSPQTGTVNGAPTPAQAVQNNFAQPQFEKWTNPAAKESATRMTASTTNQSLGSASPPEAPQAPAANSAPAGYPQQQQHLPRPAAWRQCRPGDDSVPANDVGDDQQFLANSTTSHGCLSAGQERRGSSARTVDSTATTICSTANWSTAICSAVCTNRNSRSLNSANRNLLSRNLLNMFNRQFKRNTHNRNLRSLNMHNQFNRFNLSTLKATDTSRSRLK